VVALIVVIFAVVIALMVWIGRVRERRRRGIWPLPCPHCGGTGWLNGSPDLWCRGYGFLQTDWTGEVVDWLPYDITSRKPLHEKWLEDPPSWR
jgi:hypothetical protein